MRHAGVLAVVLVGLGVWRRVLLTAVSLTAALGIQAWYVGPAVCTAVGAVLTLLDPGRAPRWSTLAANGMLLCGMYFARAKVRPYRDAATAPTDG